MTPSLFLDQDADLTAILTPLADAGELALDTEFMRERTFYPRLCLIQLATRDRVVCVDPLAIEDLSLLAALLANAGTCKVLHAARQDVEVLLMRCRQIPTPLFDTQVAAALLGFAPQIGYGELVERMLDVKLEKGHARTDWSLRPLKPEQLQYAGDDVRYLLPLRDRLQEALEKLGRSAWLDTEMQRLAEPALYRADPLEAWQRFKGLEGMDERRLAVLKALAQWREQRAMHKDLPRSWILADDAVRDIVETLPEDTEALGRLRSIPRSVMDKCGADLIAAVNATAHLPGAAYAAKRSRPDPQQQALLKSLANTVREVAETLKISPEVLATRRDLQNLVNGKTDIEPLRNWRRDVIGESLLKQI